MGGRRKPDPIGDTIWLDGIDERALAADEDSLRRDPWGVDDGVEGAIAIRINLRHMDNHRMRSMYHPDFLEPLDTVLKRPRSGRSRVVH